MLWWWVSGVLGVMLYVGLLTIFGLGCIQKGRTLWFILGLFLPILWIIGFALPSPSSEHTI